MAAFEHARGNGPDRPDRLHWGLEPGNVAEGTPGEVAVPGSRYSTFETPGGAPQPASRRGYDLRARRSSTSSRVGTPAIAPAFVQLTAAAAFANQSWRSNDHPLTMP